MNKLTAFASVFLTFIILTMGFSIVYLVVDNGTNVGDVVSNNGGDHNTVNQTKINNLDREEVEKNFYEIYNRDDAHELIQQIPSGRLDDVVLIQPDSDRHNDYDFSMNLFFTINNEDDEKYEHEVESLADDITEMMMRFSENELNHRAVDLISDIIERLIKTDKKIRFEGSGEYTGDDSLRPLLQLPPKCS